MAHVNEFEGGPEQGPLVFVTVTPGLAEEIIKINFLQHLK